MSISGSLMSHHAATVHRVATAHSDLDQSLLVVVGFLALLSVGLLLAAYMEPGTEAKPPRLRRTAHPGSSRSGRRS